MSKKTERRATSPADFERRYFPESWERRLIRETSPDRYGAIVAAKVVGRTKDALRRTVESLRGK